MAEKAEKKGFLGRGAEFMERLNKVVGTVLVIAGVTLESVAITVVGIIQFAEAALWKWLGKDKNKKGQPATVLQFPTAGRTARSRKLKAAA